MDYPIYSALAHKKWTFLGTTFSPTPLINGWLRTLPWLFSWERINLIEFYFYHSIFIKPQWKINFWLKKYFDTLKIVPYEENCGNSLVHLKFQSAFCKTMGTFYYEYYMFLCFYKFGYKNKWIISWSLIFFMKV